MRRTAMLGLWAALLLLPVRGAAQTLWAWGDNRYGQLGDGTELDSSVPVRVWPLAGRARVTGLACGSEHSLALTSDGAVWAWGSNRFGQAGTGTEAASSLPLPLPIPVLTDVRQVAAGRQHSLALRRDGTVWAWGANRDGQLGDGTRGDSAAPVQVRTPSGPLANVAAIAAGGDHSLALGKDGTVWAWGADSKGQLGDGRSGGGSSLAVQASARFGGFSGVTAIAAGRNHSLALGEDGTVWAWGANGEGQLGGGSFADAAFPVRVAGPSGIRAIAAGGELSFALGGGGALWAWGAAHARTPGEGTRAGSALPVLLSSPERLIALAAGDGAFFALDERGGVWTAALGQRVSDGEGEPSGFGALVPVPGLAGVVAMAAGGGHVLAVIENCPAITLSPSSLPGGTVGAAYSQALTASGGTAPYTFAVTGGSLPPGLSLNGATGLISGTPSALGSFSFTITATDASGATGLPPCTGSQAYTLDVGCPAIALSPSSLPNGAVAAAYAQTLTASGGTPPYAFAVTGGSLPPGLSLNGTSGLLSGTPAASGSYSFTVTATDASAPPGSLPCSGSLPYTLVIDPFSCPAVTLSPPSLPNATAGGAYSQALAAGGGSPPYTYAVTGGSLPTGLSLNGATGVISGTPSAIGSFSFTVTATDSRGCSGSQTYAVAVACPAITLAPSSLPGAVTGVAYSQTLTASGGSPPYAFAVTAGSLPAGISLNGATGLLSGTATGTGSFSFTVTATDAFGCAGSQALALTVTCPTVILSPSSLPSATVMVAFSQILTASGGTAPYAFAVTAGSLPAGFSLNGATGLLSGTATATGSFSFTVTATDAFGCWGAKPHTLAVTTCTNPPTWTPTAPLSTARQGHTATLLLNGKVLVAGGNGSSNPASALATCALYNPATATWSPTGSLATARGSQKAVLMPSGKVLAAGGTDVSGMPLAAAEVYDPAAGAWSATSPMATARYGHTLTLLPNGKVLVAGGQGIGGAFASAQVYDPGAGTWGAAPSMAAARYNHTATLLPTGKVLVAGGFGSSGALASAQLYDPGTGAWSAAASMASARSGHTATLLSNGKVLVAGGIGAGLLSSAEIYDPAAGTWSPTGSMIAARFYHSETLLLNGKVLVAGGSGGAGFLSSSELYDPAAGAWVSSGSMATTREFHTATRLPSGKVLVTGGWKGSLGLTGAELFDPAPCYPAVTLYPATLPVSTVSASYSQRIAASGECGPYAYEVLEGSLPGGTSLESATGALSGAPSAAGTYGFTVVARAVLDPECAGSQSYFLRVAEPVAISSIKKAPPFKLTVKGSNLQSGIAVFIGEDEAPWPHVTWKNPAKIVISGGKALKLKVPKGVPTLLTFVNPDGGTATTAWTW